MRCAVRVAVAQDAEASCHVLRRSITECCVKDHRDEPSILDSWLKNKTPENVRTWFERDGSFPVVAESEGAIVGVALMSAKGEVALCYLVPEARFVGAGKALLSALEVEAVRRGLDSLHLESTLTARPFYLRNGFDASGEPAVAFGITAFPMRKRLVMVQNERNDG
jgi:GNAT superfamily N-acetyltransferase